MVIGFDLNFALIESSISVDNSWADKKW